MTYLRTNFEVAHSFAHSEPYISSGAEYYRNSNKSFYYETNCHIGTNFCSQIYSYGTCIGVKLHTKKGQTVFLLNTEKYSITTSAHQSILSSSVYGIVINVLDKKSLFNAEKAIESYLNRLNYCFLKLKRSRLYKTSWKVEIDSLCDDIRNYINLFDEQISKRFLPKVFKQILRRENIILANPNIQIEITKFEKDRIRREEDIRKKFFEKQKRDFFNGEINYIDDYRYVLLRLSNDKKRIETSKGVRIPIKLAVNLYKEYLQVINGTFKGERTKKILDFKIEDKSFNEKGMEIGCHHIQIAEMERIYKELERLKKENKLKEKEVA